jgi:hypothetical protein
MAIIQLALTKGDDFDEFSLHTGLMISEEQYNRMMEEGEKLPRTCIVKFGPNKYTTFFDQKPMDQNGI